VRKLLHLENKAVIRTSSWIKANLIEYGGFLFSNHSTSLGGLDRLLVLAWIMAEIPTNDPFVFNYWDLKPENIMVDNQHNVVGYEPTVRSV
jgi:hypothetical protein